MNFRMRAAPISTTAIGHTSRSCSADDGGRPATEGTRETLVSGSSRTPTLFCQSARAAPPLRRPRRYLLPRLGLPSRHAAFLTCFRML